MTTVVDRKDKAIVAKDCSPVPTKRQRTTSPWEVEFGVIPGSKSSEKSTSFKCKNCSVVLILDSTDIEQELKCHLDSCVQFAVQTKLNFYEKLINIAVVRHGISLTLLGNITPTSTMSSKELCSELYKKEKAKLKQVFKSIPSRVSLTLDTFTDASSMEYHCLSAHYVDHNWKLNSKLLNLVCFRSNDRTFLALRVEELLEDWGITNKVLTITLDHSKSCDTMKQYLRRKVSGGYPKEKNLPCEGEFLYVNCCASALECIAQEAFNFIENLVCKIREGMKQVLACEERLKEFVSSVRFLTFPGSNCDAYEGFWFDCPGRWVSTYRMLERILRCKLPFSFAMAKGMTEDEYLRNSEFLKPIEWSRVENICKLLKPLHDMTDLFMGTEYPSASSFFVHIWETGMCLLEAMTDEDEDPEFHNLVQGLKCKFDEYWESYNVSLASAVIFDPRYKLRFVKFCYQKLDETSAGERCVSVQNRLQKIFLAYTSKRTAGTKRQSPVSYQKFEEWKESEQLHSINSQLDIYLVEPTVDFGDQLDVLSWWKQNQSRFPELSLMAIDILSTPITTFCSDSAFNTGNRLSRKWRSTVLSEDAEAQIVIRNWLYGFDIDANEHRELVGVRVPIPKS